MMKGIRKIAGGVLGLAAFIRVSAACGQIAFASDISLTLEGSSGSGKPMDMLDIMFLFLFLAVVPSLLIMMTSFTRIVIFAQCAGDAAVSAQPGDDRTGAVSDTVYHESGVCQSEYTGVRTL